MKDSPKKFEFSTVAVVGLGYVGLPLALAMARKYGRVIGFDTDKRKIDALSAGKSVIKQIPDELVAAAVSAGRFTLTGEAARLADADAVIVCVPTPLNRNREPDLTYIEQAGRLIAANLRKGQLVVLESTTYPGTTSEVLLPILETSGLAAHKDFYLAFSPEREDPGNTRFGLENVPKIVGADTPVSLDAAVSLYQGVVHKVVPVSSARTAEAVKLTENIFRAVNIALANELKIVFDAMDIDVWEVVDAAATKPFGYMPFYPGPGLGGHCIPIDPFYLTWKAREYDLTPKFIELAGEINTAMPNRVVDTLVKATNRRLNLSVNAVRVLVLGVAYKKGVEDIRESPALKIMRMLTKLGVNWSYHDPYVPEIRETHGYPELEGVRSVALTPEVLEGFDVALVCTDHDEVDYAAVGKSVRLVVDTRNAFRRRGVAANLVNA